jgi:hypothetical protein
LLQESLVFAAPPTHPPEETKSMQLFSCHVVTLPSVDGFMFVENGAHNTGAAGDFVPKLDPVDVIVTVLPVEYVPDAD